MKSETQTLHLLVCIILYIVMCVPVYYKPRVELQNATSIAKNLLHGSDNLDGTKNVEIITKALRFIIDSRRFE